MNCGAIRREKGSYRQKRLAFDISRVIPRDPVKAAAIVLVIVLVFSNVITGAIVKGVTAKRLKTEYQMQYQTEISQMRRELEAEFREAYGADEIDARTAQYEAEVKLLDMLICPYLVNITDNSIRSIVLCVISRCHTNGYADTIEEVVRQKDQWIGFSEDNEIILRADKIVREMLAYVYSGKPLWTDPKYVFMDWQNGQVTLRDKYNGSYHIWDDSDWAALGYE